MSGFRRSSDTPTATINPTAVRGVIAPTDSMSGTVGKEIESVYYIGINTETADTTTDKQKRTIRVDVKKVPNSLTILDRQTGSEHLIKFDGTTAENLIVSHYTIGKTKRNEYVLLRDGIQMGETILASAEELDTVTLIFRDRVPILRFTFRNSTREPLECPLTDLNWAQMQDDITKLQQDVIDLNTWLTKVESDLAAETEARTIADEGLEASIAAEAMARATADNQLHNAIEGEETARTLADEALLENIEAEKERAIAADFQLQEAIAEESRIRQETDEALRADIDAFGDDLAAEKRERIAADSQLTEDLATETARAIAADAELRRDIDAEAVARATKDSELGDAILVETAARQAADAAITTKINTLVPTAGGEGKYIQKVTQDADGKVTVTEKTFDTNFENPTDTNAPTTQAVKTALDDMGQVIEVIEDKIDNLDAGPIGSDGSYIKIVQQTDGLLSAEAKPFDTVVPADEQEASNINTPTTKAVRVAIDSAVSAEASARTEADQILQGNIDSLSDTIEEVAGNLTTEIETRTQKDLEHDSQIADLTTAITNEATVRSEADEALQSNINAEITARQGADELLQVEIDDLSDNIDGLEQALLAETERATTAEGNLSNQISSVSGRVDNIEALIPNEASTSNQLADKEFVNSSIATATADFLGTYNQVIDLGLERDATHEQVAAALPAAIEAAGKTATANDYVFVWIPDTVDPSVATQYNRYKYSNDVWEFEYTLNNSSFTAKQWAAINSGINENLVDVLANLSVNAACDLNITTSTTTSTYTFTFTLLNKDGAQTQATTKSITVPVGVSITDFYYDKNLNDLIITLSDGSSKNCNLNDFVTQSEVQILIEDVIEALKYQYEAKNGVVNIEHEFKKGYDTAYYTGEKARSVVLTIPSSCDQGFESGIVFRTGDWTTTFSLINNSIFPVKMFRFGEQVNPNTYLPQARSTITLLLYNDKINNNILVYEVPN